MGPKCIFFYTLTVNSHLRFITRLRFFPMGWIVIVVVKLGAQPILTPNGNRNGNRIINLSYECTFTLNVFL